MVYINNGKNEVSYALCLDADGTIIHSNRENYELVKGAWEKLMDGAYPLDFDHTFKSFVPNAIHPVDYLTMSYKHIMEESGKDVDENVMNMLANNGGNAYLNERKSMIEKDVDAWLDLLPPFDKVCYMFDQLSKMPPDVYITTNKNQEAIEMFLERNKIKTVKAILDKAYKGRGNQLDHLIKSSGFEPQNMVLFDDKAKNLEKAVERNVHNVVATIGIEHGYELPENVKKFDNWALPEEFPGVVSDLLEL